ncbi:MAG: hypothetical protein V3S17_08395 [candidate division Zixibacteria bacterium]
MNNGLVQLTSHRIWHVLNFNVWGVQNLGEIEYLNLEQVDAIKSVAFGSINIGDSSQSVIFAGLTDRRGNLLPANITKALIIARPLSDRQVFIVGTETSTGFKIARDSKSNKPVTTDLIIIELGE